MKKITNSSGYNAAKRFHGGAETQAEDLRASILAAENTEDKYPITGRRFYIAKNAPLTIPEDLRPGDAVLFERGGVWHVGARTLTVEDGVIFGAYGVGDKPRLYGSARNYAVPGIWENEGGGIWKISLPGGNVGLIVFDETYPLGVKKWDKAELTADYDYMYDEEKEILYLFYTGDPAADFESIEIGQRRDLLQVKSNAAADNLCLRYTGAHGVVLTKDTHHAAITNCEIGFIGGSRQFDTTRYGNGIEMQLGVQQITVKKNWVYQCYDAGVTFQSWKSAKVETFYRDLDIAENLIENCYYGLEFFTTTVERSGIYSEMKNIRVHGNLFRFSGYAWSYEQRPDHWMNAHIRSSQAGYLQETENLTFFDNIFDCSRASIVFWWWHSVAKNILHPGPNPGVRAENNAFYQAPTPDGRCMTYREEEPMTAKTKEEFIKAVLRFDSAPRAIEWMDDFN